MRCLKPPPVGQPATQNRPSLLQTFDLETQAVPDLASIASAGSQQVACLFRRFSFDIPLLDAGDVHGRVERLQLRWVFQLGCVFQCGNSHGAHSWRITCRCNFSSAASPEQIDNETPMDYCKEFRERRSKTSPA